MTKKPLKPLEITIDIPARRAKVKRNLPPELFRRLEAALKREVLSTRRHFKVYGWDLCWSLIQSNLYQDVFGSDLEWYVMGRFLQTGPNRLVWESSKGEFMLRRVADKRRKQRDPIKGPKRVRK